VGNKLENKTYAVERQNRDRETLSSSRSGSHVPVVEEKQYSLAWGGKVVFPSDVKAKNLTVTAGRVPLRLDGISANNTSRPRSGCDAMTMSKNLVRARLPVDGLL
jgi:hypothetical protein